jgi:hypothetical protein
MRMNGALLEGRVIMAWNEEVHAYDGPALLGPFAHACNEREGGEMSLEEIDSRLPPPVSVVE